MCGNGDELSSITEDSNLGIVSLQMTHLTGEPSKYSVHSELGVNRSVHPWMMGFKCVCHLTFMTRQFQFNEKPSNPSVVKIVFRKTSQFLFCVFRSFLIILNLSKTTKKASPNSKEKGDFSGDTIYDL